VCHTLETYDCVLISECALNGCREDDVDVLIVKRSELISRHRLNVIALDFERVEADGVLADLPEQWIDANFIVNWALEILQPGNGREKNCC
jgi:hypothetical protein